MHLVAMLEILVLLAALAVVLYGHRKGGYPRRGSFGLRRVRLNSSSGVGALAALDVVTAAITGAAADTYRLISIRAAFSWVDKQALIDDGCTFGYSHSDYSAAEVEECLEATTAIDLGDKIAQEQANRLVREVGTMTGDTEAIGGGITFNNGVPVKTRLNWRMSIGDTLNIWVRNASGVVWTTGSAITVAGEFWVKDSV